MDRILLIILLFFLNTICYSQSIDKVVAVIGDEILLNSEIESQYMQYIAEGNIHSKKIKCNIIEDLLLQKMLINQAKIDSVIVKNEEVSEESFRRLQYFEQQLGDRKKVEDYFGKPFQDIKDDLDKIIQDQFYAQRMQQRITENVELTPSEVKDLFAEFKENDIPLIPVQFEIMQIIIKPKIDDKQKENIRNKLNRFRERVYEGEDFKMLAALYSDDIASSSNGGELGFVNRGDLVPEFERAAFRLKDGEISEIVESKYGFHIIQLIERRGEQINVRHILIKPKPNSKANQDAQLKCQDIFNKIDSNIISFADAVLKYSDDESKNNGGYFINSQNMSTMCSLDDLPLPIQGRVSNIYKGDMVNIGLVNLDDQVSYRILKMNNRVSSHKANLSDDFVMISDMVSNNKKQDLLIEWLESNIQKTFISLKKDLIDCDFRTNWIKK